MTFLKRMFNPKTIASDFEGWSVESYAWLSIAVMAMLAISVSWGESLIGIVSAITGVICVVLVAKGKISNYAFGVVNVILYGYVAYTYTYYGDAMLNWLFYLPAQFIGFYYWSKQMNNDTVKMQQLTLLKTVLFTLGAAVVIAAYSVLLQYLGDKMPVADATTTVLSIVATFLMIMRYREQWTCWIIVNIVSIYMWATATMASDGAGVATLMMWVVFLVNSIYGYVVWRRGALTQ